VAGIAALLPALLLLITANTVPWLLGRALGSRGAAPLDLGARCPDGERLFGAHKTWRGLAGAVAGCGACAALLGLAPALGAAFGALAMAGDLLSSFIKRRLRFAPGRETPGLDQLPECLVPLVALARPLGLGLGGVGLLAAIFTLGHAALAGARRHRG